MTDLSMWVVEYGEVADFPQSSIVYGRHNAGTMVGPYAYCVVATPGELVLIDCGYLNVGNSAALASNVNMREWISPDVALARIGFRAEDVTKILLTHAHWDHMGGISLFPNARIVIQRRELDHVLWLFSQAERLGWLRNSYNPTDLEALVREMLRGRVSVVEGAVAEITTGVDLRPAFDSHTAGSQFVVVKDTDREQNWVFAGDVAFVRDNLATGQFTGRHTPIGFAEGSQENCILAMDEMLEIAGWDPRRVIPMHDTQNRVLFPAREFDDGLWVSELRLGDGVASRADEPIAGWLT